MKLAFVVLTGFSLVTAGCVRPIDLHSNDLPVAAVGGVGCGGSAMAQGALAATPPSFAAGAASVPRVPKAVLYAAPSQEDSTATALYVVNTVSSMPTTRLSPPTGRSLPSFANRPASSTPG